MTTTTTATPSRSHGREGAASRARLVDLGLWVATCVPVLVNPFVDRSELRAVDALAAVLALVLLLLRTRQPLVVLAVGLVAVVVVTAIVGRPNALLPASVFLLFTAAVETDRRTTIRAGLAGLVALVTCVVILAANRVFGPELLAGFAWPALAVAAGDAVRSRREAIAAAEERAVRAEATREEEARRRVAEERLHIARELHDVVAHQIAVINVQAGVAAHLMTDDPAQAQAALGTVRSSARQILDELGAIVGVLRSSDDTAPSVTPVPTLRDLPALVASFEHAGLRVQFVTTGGERPTTDATAMAIHRTVQEALTNAQRHGDGEAVVRLTRHPDEIELVVTNRVGRRGADGSGFGLVGMRERVLATGGSVTAGPGADGTFTVAAHFPVARTSEDA